MDNTNPNEKKHDFKGGADKIAEGMKDMKESIKAHDFKGDARRAADGARDLANSLGKHDFKAELLEAFAEAKKNPSSILKKPDAPRPGKDLAIAGLAAAAVLLFLLFVTSGAFFGVICLVLGIGALLLGLLGLKTEGRAIALAGTGAGVLAVLLSIGQIRSATRKPDPKDELIRLLTAQLAQSSNVSAAEREALLRSLEAAKSDKSGKNAKEVAETLDDVRKRIASDASLTVKPMDFPGLAKFSPTGELIQDADGDTPRSAPPPPPTTAREKYDHFGYNKRPEKQKDEPPEPPAGPSKKRIDEVLPILKKANIETMVVNLPNKVKLLLTKLPDGSFMGTFEVTQDQWLAVMGGENPSAEDNVGDDHPVDSVWPSDCLEFVEKLNAIPDVKKAGIQFRIPSEEEWENACLAGSRGEFGKRLDGARVTESTYREIAWCGDNMTRPADIGPHDSHPGVSHSVGRKQPNAYGLYDMHGNVEELVFEKPNGYSSKQGFKSKGGDWQSSRTEASDSGHVMEKSNYGSGQKPKPDITLGLRVAASILDKDISRILAAAEKVTAEGGAAFFGFYFGMSEADATKLAKHYGLEIGDPEKRGGGYDERNKPGLCGMDVNPVTKKVVRFRFDMQAVQALTKETYSEHETAKFSAMLSKYVGNLECVRDGKDENAPNVPQEGFLYRRDASNGTVVSFEYFNPGSTRTALLTLENTAEMASLEAAKMAATNNARIEAVEPVLNEAGIKTKTIELPGGVKLLLTQLPNERFMGTFEVTQAQYASLMGTNVSQCVGADFPVDSVSVQDCLDFMAKANELPIVKEENLRFRLPSLADWETACRAGTTGDFTRRLGGPDITRNTISDMTTPPDNPSAKDAFSRRGSHPVGVTAPNAFGLYDMFGNVSEWVAHKEVKEQLTENGKRVETRQFHLGWSWNGMNADPKIRANGNTDNYEYASPEKLAPSRGFRVSVVSWPREIQRAKDEADKAYSLSNNGRIDAVKPILEKAGIVTKVVELPGGVKLLLNKLPDGSWAAAFETTQAQWKSLLHDNPSSFRGATCTDDIILEIWRSWKDENPERLRGTGLPVDCVSPDDCDVFIAQLNSLPSIREAGLTFRIPTMDEWLFIARAGARSRYAKPLADGDTSVNHMGWGAENADGDLRLHIVGQKLPNAFGLYDVHGNAAEFANSIHGGGGQGMHAMGGCVISSDAEALGLERPIAGFGDHSVFKRPTPLNGFRLVATENKSGRIFDHEMAKANNARIDAVMPAIAAMGVETNVVELPGGVKLLMNKLPNGLWAGAFEVTQAQFLSLLGENPSIISEQRDPNLLEILVVANETGSAPKKRETSEVFDNPWLYRTGDRPVDSVTKAGADAFLKALNDLPSAKKSGLVFRLPSDLEWRRSVSDWKPASDFNITPEVTMADVKAMRERAWISGEDSISRAAEARPVGAPKEDNSPDQKISATRPVGGKQPDAHGLYDMVGNVWEWTSALEEYQESNTQEAAIHNHFNAGKYHVVGASYKSTYKKHEHGADVSYGVRADKLVAASSDSGNGDIGFRVWAEPASKRAESAKPVESVPQEPSVTPFVQASNARIDAVKPVLDAAGIETKIVELPAGVRLLMNKLPNGAWMGTFEVTLAQYFVLQGKDTSQLNGGDFAVEEVTWNVATIFATMINEFPSVKASGLHFRLPSSTEWEYACRGGGSIAPQGKPLEKGKGKLEDMGWYEKNSDIEGVRRSHRVGDRQPNAFGLYDMIGNVSELTSTAYSREGEAGSMKILRGGNFNSPKDKCTASWRGLVTSDVVVHGTGFRLYATEDGSDAKDETVTFREKEYKDAITK